MSLIYLQPFLFEMQVTTQSNSSEDQIDIQLEKEYKKYQQNKGNVPCPIRKRQVLKENIPHHQTVPPQVTFGKFKQINKAQENLTRLLELMGCRSYQQALIKLDQTRKTQKFIDAVLQMIKKCAPNEENNLHTSWKIIKDAISCYYSQRQA